VSLTYLVPFCSSYSNSPPDRRAKLSSTKPLLQQTQTISNISSSPGMGRRLPLPRKNHDHCQWQIDICRDNRRGMSTNAYILVVSSLTFPQCIGCPPRGLDLSTGLFAFLADVGLGVIYGDWTYGASAPPSSQRPSTLSVEMTSSHTTAPATSTSLFSSPASKTSTLSLDAVLSGTASATISLNDPQFLDQINTAVLRLGSIIVAGAANE
jgi:hypothetical protein